MFRCLSPFSSWLCKAFLFLAVMGLSISAAAQDQAEPSGSLNLRLMVSGGEQRKIYQELVDRFESEYPWIGVESQEYEQEVYKSRIESWLREPDGAPDIMFYFAGHLMADFYRKGLVRPITDLWQSQNWGQAFPESVRRIVVYEDQPMGLPVSYYHWGIYYRKSLFQRLNLSVPETWDELLEVGQALKSAGITPFALGSEAGWPAAAWFDYLNLRTNGLEFHQDLLAGRADFDDERVLQVFTTWFDLVERDFFLRGHSRMSWRSALPYLYQNHAGMMLMGGFVVPQFPPQIIDDIGVFAFPVIDPAYPIAEEAPTDLLFIPSGARNLQEAKLFLRFVARADIQSWFNHRLGTIAPNRRAPAPENRLVAQGQSILQRATGYSQFFDREMARSVSTPAMNTFVEFMDGELDISTTLSRLTEIRQISE